MSQENVEIVRAAYGAFNQAGVSNDFASYVREVWDRDCEYHAVEEYEPICGHDALIRWTERWFEPWETFHAEVEGRSRRAAEVEDQTAVLACSRAWATPLAFAPAPTSSLNGTPRTVTLTTLPTAKRFTSIESTSLSGTALTRS